MVKALSSPRRPLSGGMHWVWYPVSAFMAEDDPAQSRWLRIYHYGGHTLTPATRRGNGPRGRFDPHTLPAGESGTHDCPAGRSIIYLARSLGTALTEVFGDLLEAQICPQYRVAALHVDDTCRVQYLAGAGLRAIGALPALSTTTDRPLSQEWARAIHEDQPAGKPIVGIRYHGAQDEGDCLALFERAPSLHLVRDPWMPPLGRPLLELEDRVRVELDKRDVRFRAIDSKECGKCTPPNRTGTRG